MFVLKVVQRVLLNRRISWKLFNPKDVKSHYSVNPLQNSSCFYSSKPVCPPNQQSSSQGVGAGSKLLLTLGAVTLAGGATLAYAKYDANFRDKLVETLPFTESLLQYIDGANVTGLYGNAKQALAGTIGGEQAKKALDSKGTIPEPKEYKAPAPIVPAIENEVKKPQESYKEIRIEKIEEETREPKTEIAGEPKPKPSETDVKFLAELEKKICDSASEAVNAYNKAVHILLSYNQDIEYIIDEAVNQVKPETWESVKQKTRSKNECLRRAQEKADEATKDINRLKDSISRKDFNCPESTKVLIQNNIAKVQDDIEKARKELENELKHGNVTEKYWDKVEKARKHFAEELEILFPNIDVSQKKLSVEQDDLDLFILHAYANVLFYQKELAKMESILQARVSDAVEAARKGGLEPLTLAQICEAVEQEKRRLTACFQQQILKLRKEAEWELREQLKRQSQTFNDHLADAVRVRELEIQRQLSRKFDEELEEERCRFKLQLSAIVGRLRGLDEAIKIRNDADASSKQAQVLWSACQSLLRAIRSGCPGIPWKDQLRSLEPEINAVLKAAAPNDELVTAIIQGIPKEAKDNGVYPEDALRERFLKVEKVARTVALVPAEGASLPVHVLSYIESLLLIKSANPIPSSELNDELVNFESLDTNDILLRARYWLDRGDFAQTLKYMNLLQGAPRCVAKQWMNETRILLETQQAANTLMAHAASSGLMYL